MIVVTTRKGPKRMKELTWAEAWERAGKSTARERILKVFGRRRHGQELLARSIGELARVPIRSLGPELTNLKRFGLLTCEPVPRSWWGEVGHRGKLWALTDEGRRIYRIIGR
jgi:DNA-binding transcriptional ArsR family regulator